MKKTILITGAGTGIGKDAAIALSRRGHDVIAATETEEQSVALDLDRVGRALRLKLTIKKILLKICLDGSTISYFEFLEGKVLTYD